MNVIEAMEKYRKTHLVVLPAGALDDVPHGTRISVREVRVDAASKRDVYAVDGNRLALTKDVLARIAQAAGVTWRAVQRRDDRRHPHYCEFEAVAVVLDYDGTMREAIGTKTIDLRADCGDGTPGKDYAGILAAAEAKGRDAEAQARKAREYIAEMAASKAMNRAIAQILAIPRSYTAQELALPMAIPRLVPDTSDAQAKSMLLAAMMGASGALYSRPTAATLPTVAPGSADDEDLDSVAVSRALAPQSTGPVSTGEQTGPVAAFGNGAERSASENPPGQQDRVGAGGVAALGNSAERSDEKALRARMLNAWQVAKSNGYDSEQWQAMTLALTGKTKAQDMTSDEVTAIECEVGAIE
jgi:hypothetical protein